jgi:hypothetical protein
MLQQLHRIADGHSPAPKDVSVQGQPPAHLLNDPPQDCRIVFE